MCHISWKTVPDLRAECKHLGLPHNGKKQELIDRLMKAKDEAKTKILDYDRRLKAHNERRMAGIVPFPWFNKLPYDIRHQIWEHSLPGPRALCLGSIPSVKVGRHLVMTDSTDLLFPKAHFTPNPAALSVCQESRRIALKRYRLCFGSPNVYANLEIGILYFGVWEKASHFGWESFWEWPRRKEGPDHEEEYENITLRPDVVADLEQVKRLAYKYFDGWADYDNTDLRGRRRGGDQLRRDLAGFKGLKEVLLTYGPIEGEYDEPCEPGQTIFEDYKNNLEQELNEVVEVDDWEAACDDCRQRWFASRNSMMLRKRAARILPEFRRKNLTPDEKERGIPEVKVATVKRIPNVPEYVTTTSNPYGEFPELPSHDLFHLTM